MKHHRLSFFGKRVGMLFDSSKWDLAQIFIRFIKKKENGVWEKPSAQEGKVIKFNLLEIISIIEVLDHPGTKWSTLHRFQNESTPITFKHKGKNLQIQLPGYQKYLNLNEVTLFLDLLKHVYQEKVIYSTNGKQNLYNNKFNSKQNEIKKETCISEERSTQDIKPDLSISEIENDQSELTNGNDEFEKKWLETLQTDEEYYLLPGQIEARSQKAVAFQVQNKNSTWIPLSCIKEAVHSDYIQGIWVKKWFVEKKIAEIVSN